MGYDRDQPFSLTDEPLPAALDPNVDALIEQAKRERPDLAALRLTQEALDRYAEAEKAASKSEHQHRRRGRCGSSPGRPAA